MKFIKKKTFYLIFIVILAITFNVLEKESVNASMGICEDAEESGACIGDGAKCIIKKGMFIRKSCGKDPKGESIILE